MLTVHVELDRSLDRIRLSLIGHLDRAGPGASGQAMPAFAGGFGRVDFDLAGIDGLDMSGIAAIIDAAPGRRTGAGSPSPLQARWPHTCSTPSGAATLSPSNRADRPHFTEQRPR